MPFTRRSFFKTCAVAGLFGATGVKPVLAAGLAPDLRGSLDVTRLGVRPGAPDDQSRKLQKAIDAAAAEGRPLRLPAGRYKVSNINLPAGARLIGVPGQTVLVYGGAGYLVFGEKADDIALSGIVFDGENRNLDDYTPSLVHIAMSNRVTIESCDVIGSRKSGIVLDRVSGRVQHNNIVGAAEIGVQSNEAAGLTISHNNLSGIAGNGIRVWRWRAGADGSTVTNNRISRIAEGKGGGDIGNGIDVFRAHGVMISGNQIDHCTASAIRVRAGRNVQISGNACTETDATAVFVFHDSDGAMIANNVIDHAGAGILIGSGDRGSKSVVCANNLLRNIGGKSGQRDMGIGIGAAADTAITGNVIENVERIGIRIGFGAALSGVSARGNLIKKAAIGIAVSVSTGSGNAAISDNVISDVSKGAILGMEHHKIATKDLAQETRRAPPHLMISGNKVS